MTDMPRPQKPSAKPPGRTAGNPNAPEARAAAPKVDDESMGMLAPSQGTDEIGRLAHYRVLRVLGRGGMGTVYMAEDTRLRRVIALKVMLPSIAKKQIARDRFTLEALATAAIEHDHIVTIYEVNEDRGVPYLTMQFLKGMTLDDWLKAGKKLNIPQIMRIGKEIAKGLSAAHSRDLIHRDIKPSNIWLDATNKGRVKILDFGLVRASSQEDTQLTQEGMVLGTPAYMSPEQARGLNVDHRSDLFSLGCVLYRLCAGKLPFTGRDPMSMLLAITQNEPPPLAQVNSEVPAPLAQHIHQLLAKDPEARPVSALAVVQAIQSIEKDWPNLVMSGITPKPPPVGLPVGLLERSVAKPAGPPVDAVGVDAGLSEVELQETQISGMTPGPSSPIVKSKKRIPSWLLFPLAGTVAVALLVGWFALPIPVESGIVFVNADEADDAAQAHVKSVGVKVFGPVREDRTDAKEYLIKAGEEQRLPAGAYHLVPDSLPSRWRLDPETFSSSKSEPVKLTLHSPPAKPNLVRITAKSAKKIQEAWSRYLARDIFDTNSARMQMALIPPGEFLMGSSPEFVKRQPNDVKKLDLPIWTETYLDRLRGEAHQHTVRITKPFYMGVTEVTISQFSQFVAASSYRTETETTKKGGTGLEGGFITRKTEFIWNNNGFKQTKEHPVSNVTWADAEAFCKWLSKKENRVYRLPTEAEWEYACRAGTTSAWHFGDSAKEGTDYMWAYKLARGITPDSGTHNVGKKWANDFGLKDMHGNVEEMCADYWLADYYDKSPVEDPPGPRRLPDNNKKIVLKDKVARGGSFHDLPLARRSAYRNKYETGLGQVELGFRVVCEIPLPTEP